MRETSTVVLCCLALLLAAAVKPASAGGAAQLARSQGASAADASTRAQAMIYGTVQRQASMLGFADAFWLMALLFLAVIPLMFFLKRAGPAAEIPAAH